MFRISRSAQQSVVDVDAIEQIEPAVRSLPPSRWHVDQMERLDFLWAIPPNGGESRSSFWMVE